MSDLTQKADALRSTLPKTGTGTPPVMKGQLLGTLPHKDGEVRLVWDEYEGYHFLSVRLWTKSEDGSFWPSKTGFTVKLRDLPTLGEAIGKALGLALRETGGTSPAQNNDPYSRSREGQGVPF